MNSPPDPHVPPALLLMLARMSYAVTGRDPSTGAPLGLPSLDGSAFPLIVAADLEPGRVSWALASTSTAPSGFAPVLLNEKSWAVLSGGEADETGAVRFEGELYRVACVFDGVQHQAVAGAARAST